MPKITPLINDFIEGVEPKRADIVVRLFDAISKASVKLDTAIKWRQLTFAMPGDFHHWICAISLTKKSVCLIFHFGGLLDDPKQLFSAGQSKFLRKLEYETVADVEVAVVLDFVRQAIGKYSYFKENWKQIQKG